MVTRLMTGTDEAKEYQTRTPPARSLTRTDRRGHDGREARNHRRSGAPTMSARRSATGFTRRDDDLRALTS